MVIIGWNNLELVEVVENDEGCNEVAQTFPVDERTVESVQYSNSNQVVFGKPKSHTTLYESYFTVGQK